jgi:UDP-GlcNAc:undecaprenyl-phosphate GlcNAc-1-phosphate transferase
MNSNFAKKASYVLSVFILIYLLQPTGGTWAWLHNIRWFYVFFLSFIWAVVLTPLVIRAALYLGILDYPGGRKTHPKPIPRIGGAAVFAAIIFTCLRNLQFSSELIGLILGSSVIYIVGLIDDIHPLSATIRIMGQIVACAILIKGGVVLTIIPDYWPLTNILNIVLTVFWLIGLANAVNFLDGVDGLATGMMALCSCLFFFIALPTGQIYLTYVTMAIAGACIGFILFNWKPAEVFLGDSGATFLGFIVAGVAVMGSWGYHNFMVAASTPLLIMGVPIFDMIYTTISRIRNGYVKTFIQWLEYAGRDHFHHRLQHLGFSDVQTVIFILMVNLGLGLGSIGIRGAGTKESILELGQDIIIFLIITALMIVGRNKSVKKDEKIIELLKNVYKE